LAQRGLDVQSDLAAHPATDFVREFVGRPGATD
jgi:ABC-type proline/glycine betaine transport system ATPase subunit